MRRYLTTLFTVAIATVAALAATVGATPTAAASTSYASDTRGVGPEIRGFQAAFAYPFPEAAPAGANDWACRPTAAHPRPVVLVHGKADIKDRQSEVNLGLPELDKINIPCLTVLIRGIIRHVDARLMITIRVPVIKKTSYLFVLH